MEDGTGRGAVWTQGGRIFEKLKETHFHLMVSLPPRKTVEALKRSLLIS